jgi:hypothetical protein
MTRPTADSQYSNPLEDAEISVNPTGGDNARFAQIRAWLDGTHPDVQVGQVWEAMTYDVNATPQQYLITSVHDNGTISMVTVYIGGEGSDQNLGQMFTVPVLDLRTGMGEGAGYRLRAAIIRLDDKGNPTFNYSVPEKVALTSLAQADPKPKVTTTSTTTTRTVTPSKPAGSTVTPTTIVKAQTTAPVTGQASPQVASPTSLTLSSSKGSGSALPKAVAPKDEAGAGESASAEAKNLSAPVLKGNPAPSSAVIDKATQDVIDAIEKIAPACDYRVINIARLVSNSLNDDAAMINRYISDFIPTYFEDQKMFEAKTTQRDFWKELLSETRKWKNATTV